MLKSLKNKFYFIENLWKETVSKQDLLAKNSEDSMAIIQLLKMFPEEFFFPLTKWSLSPKEILHLCNEIIVNKKKNIVELGGGFSTICIAQLIKIKKLDTKFYCVENNEEWANELQNYITINGLSSFVKIIIAPLSDVPKKYAKENQAIWYDTKILDDTFSQFNNIDVLLVDGPFGGITPFARFSALPYFKDKLAPNFVIFLDDSYRVHESLIVSDWEKLLGIKAEDYKRYSVFQSVNGFNVSPYSNF